MTNDIEIDHRQRMKNLLDKRRKLLAMPAEQALDEIINSPDSLPLVHSFAEEDFFFLINEIGLDDSVQLLSMASAKQWEYIFDIDTWEKDRIDLRSVLKWFDLLLKADPDRLVTWLRDEKTEFFEFCLFKSIEVRIKEHDEDPSDFGDEFFTFDGTYYIRILDRPSTVLPDNSSSREVEEVMTEMLKRLASWDHALFQGILHEFASIIPSETEEEIYRLRNVRMAEKGFLSFGEAVGIYQPLPSNMGKGLQKKMISPETVQETNAPVSLYPFSILEGQNLFSNALQAIDSYHNLLEIESEFASLCNRIIVADQKIIREREELGETVKKACGYINIGLQHLSGIQGKPPSEEISLLLLTYPLADIFRKGYGLALELKWRAEKFRRKSWFQENNQTLGFWGEKRLGVFGGLLLKRPLFFDNFITGKLYRDFSSLADIEITENVFSEIIRFDELFSKLSFTPEPLPDYFLTYKNFLLTLWARKRLGLPEKPIPIPMDQFKRFFGMIFDQTQLQEEADVSEKARETGRIATAEKTKFVEWISEETGLTCSEVTDRYGKIFEELFYEVENEYGRVSVKNLDPRYVHLFLLQQKKDE
ncbi:MAG: DUF6178 family protein [Desulfobacterales bacterium]